MKLPLVSAWKTITGGFALTASALKYESLQQEIFNQDAVDYCITSFSL
ncbi:MAG: hypothetical protein PUP91_16365 [Rhizonema sp. PD37]|nr:hypothetical protein [Rhizonema sp. PD37]